MLKFKLFLGTNYCYDNFDDIDPELCGPKQECLYVVAEYKNLDKEEKHSFVFVYGLTLLHYGNQH